MTYLDTHLPVIINPSLLGERGNGKGIWVIAQGDGELGKYLRTLYKYATYGASLLIRPAWQEHITIVRDEISPIEDLSSFWSKYRRQELQFRIFLEPQLHNGYWSLPVISEGAAVLRSRLGLCRESQVPLHLTFGHTGDKLEK